MKLLAYTIFLIYFTIRIRPASSLPHPDYENGAFLTSLRQTNNSSSKEDDTIPWDLPENQVGSSKSCIPGTEVSKLQLEDTLSMLNEADNKLKSLTKRPINTILFLGNSGSGKTTLIQFLAGDNERLFSKETEEGSSEYVIEDDIKIGSSPIESLTLYPDLVPTDDSTAYCDTPGFKDTRSPSHEIVATYAMKTFLKTAKNIKILLLVNYPSVQQGLYKDDFMNLLRNINSMITDIDKYKNHIMLIATKVPNLMKFDEPNYSLVPDTNIIKGIAKFISNVKKAIIERTTKLQDQYQLPFLLNSVKLIDNILERDAEGNYRKINIFRRPNVSGPLSNITLLQDAKKKLKFSLANDLTYVDSRESDWAHTFSDRAKLFLECTVTYINNMIVQLTFSTFASVERYYESLTNEYNDLYLFVDKIRSKIGGVKLLQQSLNQTCNFNEFYNVLVQFMEKENIRFTLMDNDTVSKINQYTEQFHGFTDLGSIISPTIWFVPTKNVENLLDDSLSWYQYLIELFEKLSSYDTQKSIGNFNETTYNGTSLNGKRTEELNNVISKTVKQQLNVSCSGDGKLIIEGLYVRVSEVFKENLVGLHCGNYSLRTVILFALHTVFIDADLAGEDFEGVNIEIVAPLWEVIGSRRIILNGADGEPHKNIRANDGKEFGQDGDDGLPGLPGGNGGHFLGVGMELINGNGLLVESNGGNGGSGQNGGSGMKGMKGDDGFMNFDLKDIPLSGNPLMTWSNGTGQNGSVVDMSFDICSNELELYNASGREGKSGGKGGNGGCGGTGGFGGNLTLIGLKSEYFVTLNSVCGQPGNGGLGGEGAKGGQTGLDVYCFNIISRRDSYLEDCPSTNTDCAKYYDWSYHTNSGGKKTFVNCIHTAPEKYNSSLTGQSGIPNHNMCGFRKPSAVIDYQPYSDINKYERFLEENSNRILFNKTISEFIVLFETNRYVKQFFPGMCR